MRSRTAFAYVVGAVIYVGVLALGGWGLSWLAQTYGASNQPQWWTMLFKSAIVFVMALAAYVCIYLPLKWVERKWPDGPVKRLLFRERGTGR